MGGHLLWEVGKPTMETSRRPISSPIQASWRWRSFLMAFHS